MAEERLDETAAPDPATLREAVLADLPRLLGGASCDFDFSGDPPVVLQEDPELRTAILQLVDAGRWVVLGDLRAEDDIRVTRENIDSFGPFDYMEVSAPPSA